MKRRPRFLLPVILGHCFALSIFQHMKSYGIKVGRSYTFMSDPDNANKVLGGTPPTRRRLAFHATRRALLDSGSSRVVHPVAKGRIPAVSLIVAAEGIPVSGYASKLLNRADAAEGTMAFQFEKPPAFYFKP